MAIYKPDWQEARDRMAAWWGGRKIDRVPAQIMSPVKPVAPARPLELRKAGRMQDLPGNYDTFSELWIQNMEHRLQHTFWGGEWFPTHFVYLGPMFDLTYLGCEPHFTADSTWYEPCLQDWTDLAQIRFDPANRWLNVMRSLVRLSAERSGGRWLVTRSAGIAALMDTICGLLGNEKTLMAMAEHPEAVRAARDRMMPWSRQTYDDCHTLLQRHQVGSIDWMQVWAPGRVITSQCDMCVMISPAMFRDFVMPELKDIFDHVDYGIYHLDGPEQIRHLDALLSIEKLHLIQWVPGSRMCNPSHGDPMNWLDLFRRIQDAGKKVLVSCPPERVRPLLDKIARDRVFLSVYCPDESAARQVLKELVQIGA